MDEDAKLRALLKQALIEAFEEKRDLVHDVLVEALEDLATMRAIQEGEDSGDAPREEVFDSLESKP